VRHRDDTLVTLLVLSKIPEKGIARFKYGDFISFFKREIYIAYACVE
jgi:hypothetical protein